MQTETLKTAADFAKALGPHLEHEWYRCDKPDERLMGKGCRTCAVEHYISIADFRETGDLEAYEKDLKPFKPAKKKK
ncbi:MAG: hypothetical protein HYZ28_13220 [Myxococcales bacterium]|nr:hypothetical protein [Myxococcales bacterium]